MKSLNVKNYLMISVLILSASSIMQSSVFGDSSSNSPCTFTFPKGAIDLGSNVMYGAKVYPPGIYCINGAANIGSGPITLSGNGVHMFQINGTLKQAANTNVILANGAQAFDVVWIPAGATTIGANSHMIGNVIGTIITIGANSDINGIRSAKIMADAVSGNFGILSSTYTNTAAGTLITGDLGYTTGPKVVPGVSGDTHVADSAYSQAGITQNAMTTLSNAQACTDNLGTKVNLSIVNGGVYVPGVYCTTGAASIGTGGITLSGSGLYIFKINGALTTVANSDVRLINGAKASDITWVPTSATTLGASSNFAGTILDAAGVTIGGNTSISGRILAFGGTVSTGPSVTITIPAQSMADAVSGNSQCTITFPKGAVDLGSNVMYPSKVYPPGVYCIDGAANIGSGPITLSGNGIHTFKIHGALNQAASTSVALTNGAQASDVTWIPTGPTTIGANSHLVGTVIGKSITIGANSDISGVNPTKILADTISTSSQCTVTFPNGAIDLGSNVQFASKVYPPGIYCINGAANIGSGPITMSGEGVHMFKINGALNQAAGTSVILDNGARASDVYFMPTGATTIGANSHLIGNIKSAPITIGANSDINGISSAKIRADAVSGNSQCTFTFPNGAIDLGSNVQYKAKVYPPGVYCINGAANIGSGPITLSGNGVHVFKIHGALKQAASTSVILTNGAQASDVLWMPTGPTTIGANSHLMGTVIGAPITIGANSDINGISPVKIIADAVSGNFGILSSTYANTAAGTLITGDLGYTTGPKVMASVSGSTHVADSVYSQAGITQNAMITLSNAQACTDNLGRAVDLSLINGGVFPPGVYCTTGAASIGSGGITLSGSGLYLFKINGALTTVANSSVTLTNGAQASDVTWVPTSATTLGASSNFAGTILDAAGVTIGGNTSIAGRVLAFGGTVSTGPSVVITTQ